MHLSVALCVLNDTYREAARLGIAVEGVSVEADGNFDEEWCSTGIEFLDAAVNLPEQNFLLSLQASFVEVHASFAEVGGVDLEVPSRTDRPRPVDLS
jgi:hypothetical protein